MLNCLARDKTVDDVNTVIDIEKALHQVGYGTGRDADFDNAITLEEVPGSYILSYETDGSLDPATAFNQAMEQLTARFESLTSDLERVLA